VRCVGSDVNGDIVKYRASDSRQRPVIRPLLPRDQRAFLNHEISAFEYLDEAYRRELLIARSDLKSSLTGVKFPLPVGESRSELQRELDSVSARLSAKVSELFLTGAAVTAAAFARGCDRTFPCCGPECWFLSGRGRRDRMHGSNAHRTDNT
jgi:hypothetical protein